MEQTHHSQQITDRYACLPRYRLCCENESCSELRTHYCSDCDQVLCVKCSAGYHQKCSATEIPDVKDVAYCLDISKSVLSSIRQDSEHFKTNSCLSNFEEELEAFTEMFSTINEKFVTPIESSNSHEFCSIMKEVIQLQKKLIDSRLVAQSRISAELKLALSGENFSRQMISELQRSAIKTTFINQQKNSNEIDDIRLNNKQRNKPFEHKTENVQEEIKFKEEMSKTLNQTNEPMLFTRDSEQANKNRLEIQKHIISDSALKDIKQTELKILEREHKMKAVMFSRIYQKHTGKKISRISSFYLCINLNSSKKKLLISDYVTSRFKLPNLRGIRIEHISDCDSDLNYFLSNCTPARLCQLVVNWGAKISAGIKSKFYINSLSKVAVRTTKEVFFHCIDFSAEDLQTVVRASRNSKRIVFSMCCIHCSSDLDFGADLSYNTKFLSFQWCGHTSIKVETTDWKTDPSSFSLILDAIGSSGMRASLEKISIANNYTLSASKVQKELNDKGMSHISVTEVCALPLTS